METPTEDGVGTIMPRYKYQEFKKLYKEITKRRRGVIAINDDARLKLADVLGKEMDAIGEEIENEESNKAESRDESDSSQSSHNSEELLDNVFFAESNHLPAAKMPKQNSKREMFRQSKINKNNLSMDVFKIMNQKFVEFNEIKRDTFLGVTGDMLMEPPTAGRKKRVTEK